MSAKAESGKVVVVGGCLSERELKMAKRITVGRAKYLDFLSRNGGWATYNDYAQLIGVSAQVIEEKVNANELIAVKVDDVVCIPLFQYDETRKQELHGLEIINKILLVDNLLGGSSAVTWWLSGVYPRRYKLVGSSEQEKVFHHLLSQALIAGEMGGLIEEI